MLQSAIMQIPLAYSIHMPSKGYAKHILSLNTVMFVRHLVSHILRDDGGRLELVCHQNKINHLRSFGQIVVTCSY